MDIPKGITVSDISRKSDLSRAVCRKIIEGNDVRLKTLERFIVALNELKQQKELLDEQKTSK
jgi:predicted transcriptional regulator